MATATRLMRALGGPVVLRYVLGFISLLPLGALITYKYLPEVPKQLFENYPFFDEWGICCLFSHAFLVAIFWVHSSCRTYI